MPARTRPRDPQRRQITRETLEQSAFADGIIAPDRRLGVSPARRAPVGTPTAFRALPPLPGESFGSAAAVLLNAVTAAMRTIDAIEEQLPLVAEDLRWRGDRAAAPGFDRIIDQAKRLVRLAALAAQMTGEDLGALGRRDPRVARAIERTSEALDDVLTGQDAHDPFAVAETLTGPLAAALEEWRLVFAALSGEVRHAA